jgi:hypothetical protein
MNPYRLQNSADAAGLDIDDTARSYLESLPCTLQGADALVKTNGCSKLALQCGVVNNISVSQRLLDHH